MDSNPNIQEFDYSKCRCQEVNGFTQNYGYCSECRQMYLITRKAEIPIDPITRKILISSPRGIIL